MPSIKLDEKCGTAMAAPVPMALSWLPYSLILQCYPDRAADREIQMLLVKCYNHKNGCTWQGELKALEVHVLEIINYT